MYTREPTDLYGRDPPERYVREPSSDRLRIIGLPEDESRDLIAELTAHCVKPEFTYLHKWRKHDLVMWDDCTTQHKATFDYPASTPRLMHRTTVVAAGASA